MERLALCGVAEIRWALADCGISLCGGGKALTNFSIYTVYPSNYHTLECFYLLKRHPPLNSVKEKEILEYCGGVGRPATPTGKDDSELCRPNGQSALINHNIFHEQCQLIFSSPIYCRLASSSLASASSCLISSKPATSEFSAVGAALRTNLRCQDL